MAVDTRVSLWLFALSMLLGCGRTAAPPGVGDESEGAVAGTVGASASAGASGPGAMGGAASGGIASGGIASGGTAARPIDPSLPSPKLRLPLNGRATGSVWSERSLLPRFSWQAGPAFTFELQVDDSCEVGAIQSCPFASPEWTAQDLAVSEVVPPMGLPVSEEAPVGRRYYWRVRSCTSAACSPWSSIRYVDVGRQHGDFDGDGFADVVVADQGSVARQGRVLVGFGPVPSSRTVLLADAVAPETPDHFGAVAVPLGDMDADGFADLLVTAPGDQQQLPGIAYVFFGNPTFADPSSHVRLQVDAGEAAARLTAAIPAGDVDADGMRDFVVDFHPNGSQLLRGFHRDVSATPLSVAQHPVWLQMSSAGDVTGDGYSDLLLVSTPPGSTSGSRYDLRRGTATGFDDAPVVGEATGFPNAWWSITGDVNGDGFSDLGKAVNAPSNVSSFRIEVTWGEEQPQLAESATTWAGGLTGAYANVGEAMPAGDVNADGYDDSLARIIWHSSDRAQANLYLGGMGSRPAPDAVYAFQTGVVLFISESLPSAAGDVNGDGFADILLAEDYGGTAQLFFGGESLDTTPDDHLALPPP